MSDSDRPSLGDIHEVVKNNPNVNGDQFREVQDVLDKLRDEGVERATYGIRSPYERKESGPLPHGPHGMHRG